METYIAALDQGTTTSRAILFNSRGEIVSKAQYPFRQIFPQPGWVEHDPMEIWATTVRALSEAVDAAHIDPKAIAGVGITNQRETAVLWDRRTGQPVYNAIVWQCRRTAEICDRLKADGLGETVTEKTGLLIDAYFSGTKLKWIMDNIPGVRQRAERGELCAGTVDSWLIWNLTGGKAHVTDYSNASRTMLFDIHRLAWDEELCGILGVPTAMLPQPVPNSAVYGTVQPGIPGLETLAGVPAAGAEVQQRGLRPSGFRLAGIGGSGGDPGVRQRGRSAVRPVRTGLLYSRSGEEHLWDRLFHPDERGRYAGAVPQRPCDQRGLAGGGENRLRLGGQRVQRRQHHPVAPGRAGPDPERAGVRPAGGKRAGLRRRGGPGLHGPGGALLGYVCARMYHRHHQRNQTGTYYPCSTGIHRISKL